MKKMILCCLLISGLFADCNFWLEKTAIGSRVFTLAIVDKDYDSARIEYNLFMNYSRHALANCSNKKAITQLKKSREQAKSLIETLNRNGL